ncbi:MAG: hypothetical protein FWE53_02530 [Firmicutes bacterium]|nr:hypothetical protein [Bacillota bacterium]
MAIKPQSFFPVKITPIGGADEASELDFDMRVCEGIVYLNNRHSQRFSQFVVETADGKQYFYKQPRVSRVTEIIGELMASHLAAKLGINCVQYHAVSDKYEHMTGYPLYPITTFTPEFMPDLLSDFIYNKNIEVPLTAEKLLNINNLDPVFYTADSSTHYNEACSAVSLASKIRKADDSAGVKLDLFKMYFFDLLTIQTDRHPGNIVFKQNLGNGRIDLCPLFDNSLLACVSNLRRPEKYRDIAGFWTEDETAGLIVGSRRFGLEKKFDRYDFTKDENLTSKQKLNLLSNEIAKTIVANPAITGWVKNLYNTVSKDGGKMFVEAVKAAAKPFALQNEPAPDLAAMHTTTESPCIAANFKNGALLALRSVREAMHRVAPETELAKTPEPKFINPLLNKIGPRPLTPR